MPNLVPAVLALLLSLAAAPAARAEGRSDLVLGLLSAQHVPDEVLVQFARGAPEDRKIAAVARARASRIERLVNESWREDGKGDLELLRLPPGLAVAEAIGALEDDPDVEFAEPNWVYTHFAASNDPLYANGSLWGMYGDATGTGTSNAYGSQAAQAWATGHVGSASVYVGVIDEGIMDTHQDLVGQVWQNPFDPIDGKDNDGNGYVDDQHGWDFDANDNTTFDGTLDDHGTHVSGTIAARGGNGVGVAGVNWNVTLISAKFLGRRGGTTANAIRAVDYVTDLKTRHGLNIVATNNSWGGGGFSQGLLDAIGRGGDAGILFVAAAGNDGNDNDVTANYPSNYECTTTTTITSTGPMPTKRGWDCVIAVAAITSSGGLASFSNYGARTVDLGAPGQAIYSTLPGKYGASTYGSYSGTSMATPHVSGAVALYAASHPLASAADIRAAILGSATPTASLAGRTATGGRLNVSGF